jgi:diketogulonate reductase-like aldo/keto reductase
LPAVGFDTFPHQAEDSAKMAEYAICTGYRLFDTAHGYGNERGILFKSELINRYIWSNFRPMWTS